jgi:glycosyltransferase involved in cell wall biosynthesis
MKIGLTELNSAQPNIDGIGVYTQNLLKNFQAEHYDVQTIAYQSLSNLPYSRKEFLPHPLALASSLTPLGSWYNRNIEKRINLFHCTDYLIPRFKKIPVVATLHDAIMLKHPEWSKTRFSMLKNHLKKRSTRWADHYIAVSQAMVDDLVKYWQVDEKDISVVHSGVADHWFEKISDEVKNAVLRKYKLQKNFVLSVGTLQPRKNVSRLIDAYLQLPRELQQHHPLVIVGKNGWQTQDLIKKIRRLEVSHTIHWLQYVDFEDLRALYQCAKIFAFPSLTEGFGLPILEAFASNTPVITSNISSMPEIAGNAASLVDPYNTEQITDSLFNLLTNTTYREHLIQSGNERVIKFTWKNCAERTFQIYQQLV